MGRYRRLCQSVGGKLSSRGRPQTRAAPRSARWFSNASCRTSKPVVPHQRDGCRGVREMSAIHLSALGPACVKTCTDEKSLKSFSSISPDGSHRNTARTANCSLGRVQQNKAKKFRSCLCLLFRGEGTEFLRPFLFRRFHAARVRGGIGLAPSETTAIGSIIRLYENLAARKPALPQIGFGGNAGSRIFLGDLRSRPIDRMHSLVNPRMLLNSEYRGSPSRTRRRMQAVPRSAPSL